MPKRPSSRINDKQTPSQISKARNPSMQVSREKEFFIGVVSENKNSNSDKDWIVKLRTNGTEIRYKIDTGAQANVLPSEILKCINPQVLIRNQPSQA